MNEQNKKTVQEETPKTTQGVCCTAKADVRYSRVSTDELNQQATEHIHIPVIELDQFRRVKRRRMRTFGRKSRWGRNATRWQPAAAVSALLAMALLIPVILVRVYLSATGTTMNLPLEDYVTGVVAAEMPAEFRLEALKAQAIAARTFIVRRLAASDTSGVPSGAADVTDTVSHQVFIPPDQVKADWTRLGKAKEWEKLQQAVRESRDTVMTYQGKAITASFFSTSNGYTENAEDVWGNAVPYLQSVDSPWDKTLAPGYKQTVTMKRNEI
uniref:SpoIID domain-containing protein n=1 Tax=Caenorhabditis japonica TaxID=281687 RepID=A0A8R1ED03_CAEJA